MVLEADRGLKVRDLDPAYITRVVVGIAELGHEAVALAILAAAPDLHVLHEAVVLQGEDAVFQIVPDVAVVVAVIDLRAAPVPSDGIDGAVLVVDDGAFAEAADSYRAAFLAREDQLGAYGVDGVGRHADVEQ